MKKIATTALAAGLIFGLAASQPAFAAKKKDAEAAPAPAAAAPADAGIVVQGIAIASKEAALYNSDAFRWAQQQRPVTYKATYDQAEARGKSLQTQLQAMVDKYNADTKLPKPNVASLQAQGEAIQRLEASGKQEIQKILLPVALSEAFVQEQIEAKLDEAVLNAMKKKQVTLLIAPEAVVARQGVYEMTPAIVAELNQLLPAASVQLVPPQGWEPRQVREARAQQAAQQAAASGQPAPAPAAPAQPAGPQPEGR